MRYFYVFLCVFSLTNCASYQPNAIPELAKKTPKIQKCRKGFFDFVPWLSPEKKDPQIAHNRFGTLLRFSKLIRRTTIIQGKKLWEDPPENLSEFYKALPGKENQAHKIYFSFYPYRTQGVLEWSKKPFPGPNKFCSVHGYIKVIPSAKENYDVYIQADMNLKDIQKAQLGKMAHHIIDYCCAKKIDRSKHYKHLAQLSKEYRNWSLREKTLLGRLAEDLPNTCQHYLRYYHIKNIFKNPEYQNGKIHIQTNVVPRMKHLEREYPSLANILNKLTGSLDFKITLSKKPSKEKILTLHWGGNPLHFSADGKIPSTWPILPPKTTARIDFYLSYFGITVHLQKAEFDLEWREKPFELEAKINRLPSKMKLAGFFGSIYSAFSSSSPLKDLFTALVAMNKGKGSGLRFSFVRNKKGTNYLRFNLYARLKGNFESRQKRQTTFQSILRSKPKGTWIEFFDDMKSQFRKDYELYYQKKFLGLEQKFIAN